MQLHPFAGANFGQTPKLFYQPDAIAAVSEDKNVRGPVTSREFKYLPVSLRMETLGGLATPIVLRGTPLPAQRTIIFSTADDDQTTVELHVLWGESPLSSGCVSLGKFQIKGITPLPRGRVEVRVSYEVDTSCRVLIKGSVEGADISAEKELSPDASRLTEKAIAQLLSEAEGTAVEDARVAGLIESKQDAESAIRQAEKELKKLRPSQTTVATRLSKTIAELGLAIESNDAAEIRTRTQALRTSLSGGTDFFANIGTGSVFADFFATPPTTQKPYKPSQSSPRGAKPGNRAPKDGLPKPTRSKQPIGKIFGGGDFVLDPNLCFVLMPFRETFNPIYTDHIKPIVEKEGLTCRRADEIRGTNLITRDLWESINRARFLIADLTGQNPNVFYEVGLAHALGKDVLLLTQTMTDVPFDLKTLRCIVYSYTPPGMKQMELALQETIAGIVRSA